MLSSLALPGGNPPLELLAVIVAPRARLVVEVMPLPERFTVRGLFTSLLATLTVPGRLPEAVGVKVTLTVQDAPAASELPQVVVWA